MYIDNIYIHNVYIYTHKYTYIHTYTHTQTYIHTYIQIHRYTDTHIHVNMYSMGQKHTVHVGTARHSMFEVRMDDLKMGRQSCGDFYWWKG